MQEREELASSPVHPHDVNFEAFFQILPEVISLLVFVALSRYLFVTIFVFDVEAKLTLMQLLESRTGRSQHC